VARHTDDMVKCTEQQNWIVVTAAFCYAVYRPRPIYVEFHWNNRSKFYDFVA